MLYHLQGPARALEAILGRVVVRLCVGLGGEVGRWGLTGSLNYNSQASGIDNWSDLWYIYYQGNHTWAFGLGTRGRRKAAPATLGGFMKTNVYIDGFNLYYGCVKGTPYKWLDPLALLQKVFPKNQIHRVKYFTALVSDDPQKEQRQSTYIRALETIPVLSVQYGYFQKLPKMMPLVNPPAGGPRMVEVLKTEEKGSDVNLATALIADGFNRDYEVAIVVSNDSDLSTPIRYVRDILKIRMGVLNPQKDKRVPGWRLRSVSTFYRRVRPSVPASCQFPATMRDRRGTFSKPAPW